MLGAGSLVGTLRLGSLKLRWHGLPSLRVGRVLVGKAGPGRVGGELRLRSQAAVDLRVGGSPSLGGIVPLFGLGLGSRVVTVGVVDPGDRQDTEVRTAPPILPRSA